MPQTVVRSQEVDVEVFCVPKAVELADPATEGCGYRGTIKGIEERVQFKNEGDLIPHVENDYLSFVDDSKLACPECGHELTPQRGGSARVARRRNLRNQTDPESEGGLSPSELRRLQAMGANRTDIAVGP